MDPFDVLGVRPGASHAEVRRAFGTAVREAHPDAGGPEAEAAERLARLIEARDRLLGTSRRTTVTTPVTIYHQPRGLEWVVAAITRGVLAARRTRRNLR